MSEFIDAFIEQLEKEVVAAAMAWHGKLSQKRRYRPYNSATLMELHTACKKLAAAKLLSSTDTASGEGEKK